MPRNITNDLQLITITMYLFLAGGLTLTSNHKLFNRQGGCFSEEDQIRNLNFDVCFSTAIYHRYDVRRDIVAEQTSVGRYILPTYLINSDKKCQKYETHRGNYFVVLILKYSSHYYLHAVF